MGSVFLILLGVGYRATETGRRALGDRARGDRLERMKRSPQWRDGHFANVLSPQEPNLWRATKSFLFDGSEYSRPADAIPVVRRSRADFVSSAPARGLRITWLGHSTLIVEIDGARVLVDPVWGDYAAPFSWMGTQRFYPPPLPFDELPDFDAIVISHDHYDHLDYPTVLRLATVDRPFVVPLGVGAHLERWGIAPERIVELDWWGEHRVAALKLVATPARHFSGRSLTDRDATLWAGWALIGAHHRVFYSGDTAMFPGFTDIGERLGPFDATLIESGAYSSLWPDVHLGPEQAVQAHKMVRGRVMIPVHWGLFDLAMHGWTEPMERVLSAARHENVIVATPRPGETIEPSGVTESSRWWPAIPWESAEQSPVVSTGLSSSANAEGSRSPP